MKNKENFKSGKKNKYPHIQRNFHKARAVNFSAETLHARRQWNDISKC